MRKIHGRRPYHPLFNNQPLLQFLFLYTDAGCPLTPTTVIYILLSFHSASQTCYFSAASRCSGSSDTVCMWHHLCCHHWISTLLMATRNRSLNRVLKWNWWIRSNFCNGTVLIASSIVDYIGLFYISAIHDDNLQFTYISNCRMLNCSMLFTGFTVHKEWVFGPSHRHPVLRLGARYLPLARCSDLFRSFISGFLCSALCIVYPFFFLQDVQRAMALPSITVWIGPLFVYSLLLLNKEWVLTLCFRNWGY